MKSASKPLKTENQVKVYMSDDEYDAVKKAAERVGLSVSTWMRVVCLSEARKIGKEGEKP